MKFFIQFVTILSLATSMVAASPIPAIENGEFVERGHRSSRVECKKYFIDEGYNVSNTNDNDLLDLSNLGINLDILRRGRGSRKIPRKCSKFVYSGGHNIVNKNDNDLLDLKNLFLGLDILKRDEYRFDGGHNVEHYNDNDLLDLENLLIKLHLL